jgi:Cu2+-containing amine oxidase
VHVKDDCHRAGFKLMPSGFFARNPALDVPK